MRAHVPALLLTVSLMTASAGGASAAPAAGANGSFTAAVDFSTLTVQPAAQGTHCELTVSGVLTFTGSLSGTSRGQTTAYVLATCEEFLGTPPGTYRDLFSYSGDFAGTVDGTPATGTLTYAGVTHPGGAIDARIRLTGDEAAELRADATLAVGGTYVGVLRP